MPKIALGCSRPPRTRFFDHERRAAALAGEWAFFSRLENKLHRAVRSHLRMPASTSRSAHEHRSVCVVTAGMHDTGILTVELPPHLRCEGNISLLSYRQRVHIRT